MLPDSLERFRPCEKVKQFLSLVGKSALVSEKTGGVLDFSTRHCSERGAREDLFCFLGLWSCWEDFGWERMSLAVTLHDNLSISWLAMGSQELQSLQCPFYMDL